MWRGRREFWLSYLPYVNDAWLVVGPDAVSLAERESTGFARFGESDGTHRRHCGLLLQIRNMCVLEMNLNGRAIFWDRSNNKMPTLRQRSYNRRGCLDAIDGRSVFGIIHNSGWQGTFRNRILQMTGINVR